MTPEMLESAIDAALNKRPTYCSAIDTDGRRYVEQPDGGVVIEDRVINPTMREEHSSSGSWKKTILQPADDAGWASQEIT